MVDGGAAAIQGLERRHYNKLGPQRPLIVKIDLDAVEDRVALALIGSGDENPVDVADLALMGAQVAGIGFVSVDAEGASALSATIRLSKPEFATLAVDREPLLRFASSGRNRLVVKAKIVRTVPETGAVDPRTLFLELQLFRSRAPDIVATLTVEDVIDVERLGPQASRVSIARLDFTCEPFDLRPEGRRRLRIESLYTGFGAAPVPASIRVSRLRDDLEDEHWRETAEPIVEAVEIDGEQLRATLRSIEFGVSYAELRDFVGRLAPPRAIAVWFRVSEEPDEPDAERRLLVDAPPRRVEVVGEVRDRLLFSGLSEGAPAAVFLTSRGGRHIEARYELSPIRLRRDSLGRPVAASRRDLRVSLDGPGSLLVEVDCAVHLDGRECGRLATKRFELTEGFFFAYDAAFESCLPEPIGEDAFDDARCVVTLQVRRSGSLDETCDRFEFVVPLQIEDKPPDWLACIDFGASSTAIRMSSGRTDAVALDLRLGDWLAHRIDREHEEFVAPQGAANGAPVAGYLMPSRIGLSSDFNTRAQFDPLSLGDLALAQGNAAADRLAALEAHYDVSLPFPGREALAQHIEYVIVDLKRRMISRARTARLPADVVRRGNSQSEAPGEVDLARLLGDCFHELGAYIAPGALTFAAASGARERAMDPTGAIEADRGDLTKRFGAIVTHPAGIDADRRRAYREAGLRFLDGFHPASNSRGKGAVSLIGEALAAARFGVQKHMERPGAVTRPLERDFITLDIGAGTYDVTIVRADLTPSGLGHWRVIDHFGLACGGADLDAAIATRVRRILQAAQASPAISSQFEIDANLAVSPEGLREAGSAEVRRRGARFLAQVHAAKARLTSALFDDENGYVWRSRADGGPPLDIQVGRLAIDDDWPVRLQRTTGAAGDFEIEIPDMGASIAVATVNDVKSIRLKCWPEAFDAQSTRTEEAGVEDWIELMAREIPGMAWRDYRRRTGDVEQEHPPIWIVTGRAALWPHLYQGIAATLGALGPQAGGIDTQKPPTPYEMKRAVVEGAGLLAREPWARADENVRNPVALLAFGVGLRGAQVVPIVEDDEPSPPDIFCRMSHSFAIARIAPGLEGEGLDRRIALFQRLRVACWEELASDVRPPPEALGEEIEWTVSARRDASGLSLTLTPKTPGATSHRFGPFKESRLYGQS